MSLALSAAAASGGTVLVSETGVERLQLVARAGAATFLLGGTWGKDELPSGPGPYGLLSAALAACTAMTVRLYAERKRYPLTRVQVGVAYCRSEAGSRAVFERTIHFAGALDKTQTERLLEIANLCPVGKTLSQGSDIRTSVVSVPSAGSGDPDTSNYVQDAQQIIAEIEGWGPDA